MYIFFKSSHTFFYSDVWCPFQNSPFIATSSRKFTILSGNLGESISYRFPVSTSQITPNGNMGTITPKGNMGTTCKLLLTFPHVVIYFYK